MRLLRIAGGATAGLLLLALAAAWFAPLMMDWNDYRGAIAGVASTSLGRPVRIGGTVSLTLLPRPVLVASGVTLPDPGDGFSADVAELRLQVGLGPLLTGRLEAEDLTLNGARMRLPWPFRAGALQQNPPNWLTGLQARVEDGTLLVGGLTITDIAGTLAANPLTGTFSVDGFAAGLGRRWRVTARLGRAGGDGSVPLEASLDGQDATQDTGGTFSGQLAQDGTLAGRVVGRGRDLSQLIAGPAAPWHASGRFHGADGLALADDLDVEIGGVPARGAVALRLLPEPRLDAALATSRLDLAAWLPHLLSGGSGTFPTSVDLSAEAATLAAGTLRHVRFAFDLAKDGVILREAEAILPGDATVALSGRFAAGRFNGTGKMSAPDLRAILAWLRPVAPALVEALPPDVLQTATIAAAVTVAGGKLTLDGLKGLVDGSAVSGTLALQPGDRPEINAALSVAGPNLDLWFPKPPADLLGLAAALSDWPGRWGGVNAQVTVSATKPRWRGATLERLELDAALRAGTLTLRRVAVTGPDFSLNLAGALVAGGHITDGRVDASLGRASVLAPLLPAYWPLGLFQGQAALHATAAGEPGALGVALHASLADLRMDAAGTADLGGQGWNGTVDLHHPGAPRLLEAMGATGVASWLGDGSFSLAAGLALDPRRVALNGFSLSAGALRLTGDIKLDRGAVPVLTGQVDAETLPLPLPYIRSPDPLPVDLLRFWRGQLAVKAAHVLFGLSPAIDHAAASVVLADGVLHMTGLTAEVAGGKLAATLGLDVSGSPRLAAQGTLSGAALSGPLFEGTVDVTSGRLDVTAKLGASGFSPGALLATLAGTAQITVADGVLNGVDLASADAALALPDPAAVQAGVVKALQGGRTDFSTLAADITVQGGAVMVREGALSAASGRAALSGTLDLPIGAADLLLALTPARPNAPAIGLRLIGPAATPRRMPELAALAAWLVAR